MADWLPIVGESLSLVGGLILLVVAGLRSDWLLALSAGTIVALSLSHRTERQKRHVHRTDDGAMSE